ARPQQGQPSCQCPAPSPRGPLDRNSSTNTFAPCGKGMGWKGLEDGSSRCLSFPNYASILLSTFIALYSGPSGHWKIHLPAGFCISSAFSQLEWDLIETLFL